MIRHVLIVDDHPLMRLALRTQIETEPGWSVAGEAANGQEALEKATALHPDVILMDLLMPGVDGVTATRNIMRACPETHILVLTSSADNQLLAAALGAGAHGCLLKEAPSEDLLRALRDVGDGHFVISPVLMRRLFEGQPNPAPAALDALSAREQEVLACIGQGASNRVIAERLAVTEGTVRTYVRNILGKLRLANRTEAALYAAQAQVRAKTPPPKP
jgi:DNA-binding NarL/FixJ family response regulator